MKRKILLISLCCLLLPARSQKVKLNDSWQFQRLAIETKDYQIANQGTSWESQFNITHTALNSELKVSGDTLRAEFGLLQTGEWERVNLPHTPKVEDLIVLQQWQGICYYKKEINYTPQWDGCKIWMEFEGAM